MNLISLNLKAVTPLELYFESNLKQCEEHFMMAFVIKGYTEQQLIDLNTELARMKKLPDGGLSIIKTIAVKLDLLKEFNMKLKGLKWHLA